MANIYKRTKTVTDPKTGEKTKVPSKNWWGRYRDAKGIDRRLPLSPDKKVAQLRLSELVQQVEREKSGLADGTEVEMKKPIQVHLDAYEQHLIAKNDTPRHIKETLARIKRVLDDRKIKTAMQLKTVEVEAFINDIRTENNTSLETCNHYMRSVKSFAKWMLINERLLGLLKVISIGIEVYCRNLLEYLVQSFLHAAFFVLLPATTGTGIVAACFVNASFVTIILFNDFVRNIFTGKSVVHVHGFKP